MAPKICRIFVIYFLILETITSAQSSIKQYLHVTGVGPHSHSAGLATLPTVGMKPRQVVPAANTGLSALSALALPQLISALQQSAVGNTALAPSPGLPTLKTQPIPSTPSVPTSKPNTPSTNIQNGGIDSNVLNNLAIALQLLIVSNILNSAPDCTEANPVFEMLETAKNIPASFTQTENRNSYPIATQVENYEQAYVPNANYVGTSGFADMGVTDPYKKTQNANTRNSFQLMSPYEALGPNSPFSDPILSGPFGNIITSKKDFQSPYSMINEDLFSMSDIF